MISVYQLKPAFQNLLRPIVKFLAEHGVTANQVTISAFLLSCCTGAIVYAFAPACAWVYLLLPVFLFVRMALNAFDGMLAREYNQKSRLGAIYNEMGDILSDLALYIPFWSMRHVCLWNILAFSLLLTLTETAGIMGLQIQASRRYDGPMGKSDRAFWIGALGLLAVFNFPSPCITNIVVWVLNALMLYTIWNRFSNALKEQP
jgi:CDP-diacylglycerol--glycerol-3-phosphate 3-phosphatidyltransferase